MESSSSDYPPSYDESRADSALSHATYVHNQSMTRQSMICDLFECYILPHLAQMFSDRVPQHTLVFVPSSVSALIPPTATTSDVKDPQKWPDEFPGELVVGFPAGEKLTLIRLRGGNQTIEFWRQPAVISEVERRVFETLTRDGLEVSKRSPSQVYWSLPEEKPLAAGEARVGVEMREVCLRIENQLGLYETRSGKALVLRVEAGCQKFEFSRGHERGPPL